MGFHVRIDVDGAGSWRWGWTRGRGRRAISEEGEEGLDEARGSVQGEEKPDWMGWVGWVGWDGWVEFGESGVLCGREGGVKRIEAGF